MPKRKLIDCDRQAAPNLTNLIKKTSLPFINEQLRIYCGLGEHDMDVYVART